MRMLAKGKAPCARELEEKFPKHMVRGHLVSSVQKTAKGLFVGRGVKLRLYFAFGQHAHLNKRFAFCEDFKRVIVAGLARRFPAQLQRAVNSAFAR